MSDPESQSEAEPAPRWAAIVARLRKPIVVVAAVGTVLGGLAGYVTMYRTVASPAPAAPATAAPEFAAGDSISILVLPLANHTGDPAKAYIADALTTAITSDLSRIQDAVIVPPVTAVALQEKKLTLQQLGTEARVRFVMQGAASVSGERLRVNAQLSDTRSGRQLWSQVFEAPMGDLFALQDDLTPRIRASVGPQMLLAAAREAQSREKNPQVADLVLRLRALELNQQSLVNLKQTQALARQALAIDPLSLRARTSLARTQWLLANNFADELGVDVEGRKRLSAEAAAEAAQVLKRDPDEIVMYSVLAYDAQLRGDFDSARRIYERALEINPRLWSTYNNLGAMLIYELGLHQEARPVLLKALQFPSYQIKTVTYLCLSEVGMVQGAYDEAIDWLLKAVQGSPDHAAMRANLAIAYGMKGDEQRARAVTAELMQRHPGYRISTPLKPWPGNEAAFRAYYDRVLPAARLAGLKVSRE